MASDKAHGKASPGRAGELDQRQGPGQGGLDRKGGALPEPRTQGKASPGWARGTSEARLAPGKAYGECSGCRLPGIDCEGAGPMKARMLEE
jgi:hypothetical protein